jgi:hypothetical protein
MKEIVQYGSCNIGLWTYSSGQPAAAVMGCPPPQSVETAVRIEDILQLETRRWCRMII